MTSFINPVYIKVKRSSMQHGTVKFSKQYHLTIKACLTGANKNINLSKSLTFVFLSEPSSTVTSDTAAGTVRKTNKSVVKISLKHFIFADKSEKITECNRVKIKIFTNQ